MRVRDAVFYIFLVWYAIGVVLVGFDLLPSWLEWSNSVFNILAGLLGLIYFVRLFGQGQGLAISAIIFIFTYVVEYFGASVSFLFGSYDYTGQFQPVVMGVPMAIGFAWIMVLATGHAIVRRIGVRSIWLQGIVAAALATLFDAVLDPVAFVVKDYWRWTDGGVYYDIPVTNFTGWFIVAFVLMIVIQKVFHEKVYDGQWNGRMWLLYCLMVGMFTFIALLNGLWLAGVIGVVVIAVVALVWRREGANA